MYKSPPSKILVPIANIKETTRAKKCTAIFGLALKIQQLCLEMVDLPIQLIEQHNFRFVGYANLGFTFFRVGQILFELRKVVVLVVVKEGSADKIFGIDIFDSKQVQEHVVREMKRGQQRIWFPLNHGFRDRGLHLFVQHQNNYAAVVKATSTRSSAHLDILSRSNPTRLFSVPFPSSRENNGLGRHVQSHGKGFSCKKDLDQSFLKKNFNGFLENRKQSRVMDPDTPAKKRQNILNLGQCLIFGRQRLNGILENHVQEFNFFVVVKIQLCGRDGKLFARLFRERENDEREVVTFFDQFDNSVNIVRSLASLAHFLWISIRTASLDLTV